MLSPSSYQAQCVNLNGAQVCQVLQTSGLILSSHCTTPVYLHSSGEDKAWFHQYFLSSTALKSSSFERLQQLQCHAKITRGSESPCGKVSLHTSRSMLGMSSQDSKSWGNFPIRKASTGTLVRPVLSQMTRGSECFSSSCLWASVKT